MDAEIPSNSSDSESNQKSLNDSLTTTQDGSASAVTEGSSGSSSSNSVPGGKVCAVVYQWFSNFEDEVRAKFDMKDPVVQWLGERWCTRDERSTEAPMPTTPERDAKQTWPEQPKLAVYWWHREQKDPKAPAYWWQKEKGVRAPSAPASSTATTSVESDDAAMVAELMEKGSFHCCKNCPHLDFSCETPNSNLQLPKKQGQGTKSSSSSDFDPLSSCSPHTRTTPSIESLDLNDFIWLKCKPHPRSMSASHVSEESSPEEEEVPHIIFSFNSIEPRRSRSTGRKSRSLERERISHSLERDRPAHSNTMTQSTEQLSSSTSDEHSERPQPKRRFRSKLRRLFNSEDNIFNKIAWRTYSFYCCCLCYCYQAGKYYNKFSEDIRRMNRENR